jgi:peptide-methionine (S)-S-oxide reductase
MKKRVQFIVPAAAGLLSAAAAMALTAGAQSADNEIEIKADYASAVFAGGCFWCVEADFDKVPGVVETISGFAGGTLDNPSYKQVTAGGTGHYEAVKVTYDPSRVSYRQLVDYFYRHVDPTDAGGQFCDRGESYRTAIFTGSVEEKAEALAATRKIEDSGVLDAPVVTVLAEAGEFWPAEDYHQNYYKKSPIKYRYYRSACGRDARVQEIWGKDVSG